MSTDFNFRMISNVLRLHTFLRQQLLRRRFKLNEQRKIEHGLVRLIGKWLNCLQVGKLLKAL